ncbi:50S ribosomal protein L24 [Patescibacteria group bacterium]
MNIKKGDTVKILRGKDAGRTGKVLRVFPKKSKIIVEDINKVKRHVKKQSADQPGGIVEVEKPLHLSKVVLKKDTKPKKTTKKSTKKTTKTTKKAK